MPVLLAVKRNGPRSNEERNCAIGGNRGIPVRMPALVAFLVALALGCAGARFGVFGGYLGQTGEIEGTKGGGPIDTRAGGPFVGASLSWEVSAPSPPREAPLYRLLDDRLDERDLDRQGQPQEDKGDGFGWQTLDPTSNIYALVAYVVAAAASALAAAKARNGAPPTT